MARYTSHSSFASILSEGGYDLPAYESLESIPADEWNQHICQHTEFKSWDEMQQAAGQEWAKQKLGF